MANRTTYPLVSHRAESEILTGKVTGAGGTADLVVSALSDIASAAYAGSTGLYNIVFKYSYPQLKSIVGVHVIGTTAGLRGRFTALDVTAKTAQIIFEVGSVATVLATTDVCYINLMVRNSGRNPSS